MDKLWKWVMHLNAKAFCVCATLFLFGVTLWCGWMVEHPKAPLKDGVRSQTPELSTAWEIGTLDFVSNQLANETMVAPVDPFRPTIEAIFTNETERVAFLKALKNAQNAAAGIAGSATAKKEDPFAHLRKKAAVPGALVGPNGRPMIIPKLTFMGFIERPDGKRAALFYDSAKNTTVFYDSGKQVHGVDVLDANVHEAQIKFPDGTTRTLPIGGSVELAAEPDTSTPAKKTAPAAAAGKNAGKKDPAQAQKADQQKQKKAVAQKGKAAQKKAKAPKNPNP